MAERKKREWRVWVAIKPGGAFLAGWVVHEGRPSEIVSQELHDFAEVRWERFKIVRATLVLDAPMEACSMMAADIEAVARAMCVVEGKDADFNWTHYRARARYLIAADPGRKRMEEALREMLDASAACMRIIASAGLSNRLQAELAAAGIKDGFGTRARAALDGGSNG